MHIFSIKVLEGTEIVEHLLPCHMSILRFTQTTAVASKGVNYFIILSRFHL